MEYVIRYTVPGISKPQTSKPFPSEELARGYAKNAFSALTGTEWSVGPIAPAEEPPAPPLSDPRFSFLESFEMWRCRVGHEVGTITNWHQLSREAWTRVKAGTHYHGGIPCANYPACWKRYVMPADLQAFDDD